MRFTGMILGLAAMLLAAGVVTVVMRGWQSLPSEPEWEVPGGSPARGRPAIARYGCGSCHTIPGIQGATARVGPLLTGLRNQTYVAGRLPNVPYHLVAWIENPQRISPGTAMPNLHVTDADARDIAAYLYAAR
jgi:cytochrome c